MEIWREHNTASDPLDESIKAVKYRLDLMYAEGDYKEAARAAKDLAPLFTLKTKIKSKKSQLEDDIAHLRHKVIVLKDTECNDCVKEYERLLGYLESLKTYLENDHEIEKLKKVGAK